MKNLKNQNGSTILVYIFFTGLIFIAVSATLGYIEHGKQAFDFEAYKKKYTGFFDGFSYISDARVVEIKNQRNITIDEAIIFDIGIFNEGHAAIIADVVVEVTLLEDVHRVEHLLFSDKSIIEDRPSFKKGETLRYSQETLFYLDNINHLGEASWRSQRINQFEFFDGPSESLLGNYRDYNIKKFGALASSDEAKILKQKYGLH